MGVQKKGGTLMTAVRADILKKAAIIRLSVNREGTKRFILLEIPPIPIMTIVLPEENPIIRTKTRNHTDDRLQVMKIRKVKIKLKLVKPGKFVETRFDDRQPNVTFRKRKNKTEGEFNPNDKYSRKKQLEYQKNNVDYSKPIRLNKFLANAGICSRREADEFIQSGVISVNGEVVTQLGAKIMMTDTVMFKNQPVQSERKVYLLLNKPKDCLTTSDDPNNRKTVLDLVKNACSERIYPVGRLDRNTTGVLLLTNDGDLAAKLTHPKYNKKKIYHAVLDKNLETVDYESIIQGVDLGDEHVSVDALEFVKAGNRREIGIEIHSGQNRVVRRIFEKFGYKVVYLDRVYFAGLTKKNVPRGKYRFLTQREINMLKMGAYE